MPVSGNDDLFLPTRLPQLQPLHFGNFGQQNTTTVASAIMSQSMQPFSSMASQNVGGNLDPLGSFQQTSSVEQQMTALQGMNESQLGFLNQQQIDQQPYPQSWFRMNQGGPLQSLLDHRSLSMASMMPNTAPSTSPSTMPPASFLANHQPLMNPLLPLQVGSESHAAINSTIGADDDPFEPVPLLEDISRRHSQGK